jgi:hypothetical protein
LEILRINTNIRERDGPGTVASAGFTGELPATIGNLVKMTILEVYSNSFEGELPATIGNAVSLELLDLEFNKFEGELPVELGSLMNLSEFYLSGNNFVGAIPDDVCLIDVLDNLYPDCALDCACCDQGCEE